MGFLRWRNLLRVAVCAVIYVTIICVYLKSLQQHKHVWNQFSLRDKHKAKRAAPSHAPKAAHRAAEESRKRASGGVSSEGAETQQALARRGKLETGNGTRTGKAKSTHGSRGKASAKEPDLLEVVVVEEHHEVIPYWFGAAESGLIPKTGNTLIHIDGHNDLGPPLYLRGYPHFRWPSTQEELRYLMQRNDAFIQGAAMAGLIERSIWVWPLWDRKNHESDYISANLSLGWFIPDKHSDEMAFCMCVRNDTGTKDECVTFQEYESYSFNSTSEVPGKQFEGFPVPARRCRIEKRILVEEVSETKAVTMLRKENWLPKSQNVILDIDEDYFGCTFAIRPLLDVNVSIDRIQEIDETLGSIFCPSTLEHEKILDDILQDALRKIRQRKACSSRKMKHRKSCRSLLNNSSTSTMVGELVNVIQTSHRQTRVELCTSAYKQKDLLTAVKVLMINIHKLNSSQIKQMQYVGFCSETSPLTMIPDNERRFGLCSGANSPNKSVVLEFRPTGEEIAMRSRLLTRIFEKLKPISPKLVTVCRSIRDGYTPRDVFGQIEEAVLTGLNKTFRANIKYDGGLIGGKAGWSAAHVKLMQ